MAASVTKLIDISPVARQLYRLKDAFLLRKTILAPNRHFKPPQTKLRASVRRGRPTSVLLALTLPFVPTVHAFWGSKSSESATPVSMSEQEQFLKQMDELHEQHEIVELCEKLGQHQGKDDDEILWRLARGTCDLAKMAATTKEKKKELMFEAFGYAERALKINDGNFACHKWYAILLDYTAEYIGTKTRIERAFEVKEHLLKAAELNPQDATTIHSLGYWCFLFADMPWYQRKVASVIFSTPPTSTYDEALEYFLKAEETSPNFYSMNLLLIGRTYLKKNDKEKAKEYLIKAKDHEIKTEDDKKCFKEANDHLKSL